MSKNHVARDVADLKIAKGNFNGLADADPENIYLLPSLYTTNIS